MFDNILFFPFMATGILIYIIIGVLLFIFWIWMIVDSIQRRFRNDIEKIIWAIVAILGGWMGALIYYFVIRVYNPRGLAKK